MYDQSPLSHHFYLRDIERQFRGDGPQTYRAPRSNWLDRLAVLHRNHSGQGGLVAYAVILLIAGGLF